MVSELAPGTEIGQYRIAAAIGRGGMGTVYRAEDLRLGRAVALKVLAAERATDEAYRERFIRESRILASLDDPHIVPIFDAGEADGRLYIAMRLVTGPDLRTVLESEGPLDPGRATQVVAQLADALDAAHARGLVHRDVKPANVLLAPGSGQGARDHVYLSDFGLTKQASSDTGLTAIGSFIGTPGYVAPEQIEGKPLDHRVDVYALGCVLYSCLTGELVYPRDSTIASLWAHLQEAPPRPSVTKSGVPAAFDDVVEKAMARNPAERFQTAGGLAAAARAALQGPASADRARDLAATVVAPTPEPDVPTSAEDVPEAEDLAIAAFAAPASTVGGAGPDKAAAVPLGDTVVAPGPDVTRVAPDPTAVDEYAVTAPFDLAQPAGAGSRRSGRSRRTVAVAAALAAVVGTSGLAFAFAVGGIGGSASPTPDAGAINATFAPAPSGDDIALGPSPSLSTSGPGVPATPAPTPEPTPVPTPTPTRKPASTPEPTPVPDTRRPTGSVKVDAGKKYSSDREVRLSLSAKDNRKVTKMRISNGTDRGSAKEYKYAKAKNWTLTKGVGKKSVSVWYSDGRNWSKRYADSIIYDRAPVATTGHFDRTDQCSSIASYGYVRLPILPYLASDPDSGDSLKVVKVWNGGKTYPVESGGKIVRIGITPTSNFSKATFTDNYTVQDEHGRRDSSTFTLTVGPCP